LVEEHFPDYKMMPVINGALQADSLIRVNVSFTANMSESFPINVMNANIYVFCGGQLSDTLKHEINGWYKGKTFVRSGNIYAFTIHIPGYDTLYASVKVPYKTPITNLIYKEFAAIGDDGDVLSSYSFDINNSPADHLYWEVSMVEEGIHSYYDAYSKEITYKFGRKPHRIIFIPGIDPVLLDEASPKNLISNSKMINDSYGMCFYFSRDRTNFSSRYEHYIELRSVDESYYKFHKQYILYLTSDFDQIGSSTQNYPLFSNVENGLGIIYAMSVDQLKIER
jgi:hypothetical protein